MKWKVWQGLFHVFILFDMPEADLAIKEIGDFFKG
ncbi:acetyl esterase/lipase [Lactobacillus colini]|uniref:Acetyl esterase/lipase n=1 Tax=Lactobacillus colini TaxID=1819254 RepID=A0ABS4MCS9_9LACO|nr:acetyl esterase/lipase [Lactobacillus colini]